MSYFRQIHTSMWKDEYFMEFTTTEKLLFIYFFSNEMTTLSGVYKIPMKVIQFETGIQMRYIESAMKKFEEQKKIYYRDGIVFVVNFQKYNKGGDKVAISIRNEIDALEDCEIKYLYMQYYHPEIGYQYPIHTPLLSRDKKSKDKISKEESSRVEENAAAATFPEDNFSELSIWTQVTGMMAYPIKARSEAPYMIRSLLTQHKENTVEYCKPYFKEWLSRGYNKSNHSWLDWAIAGSVPKKNGKTKFTNYDKPDQPSADEIEKALKGE